MTQISLRTVLFAQVAVVGALAAARGDVDIIVVRQQLVMARVPEEANKVVIDLTATLFL